MSRWKVLTGVWSKFSPWIFGDRNVIKWDENKTAALLIENLLLRVRLVKILLYFLNIVTDNKQAFYFLGRVKVILLFEACRNQNTVLWKAISPECWPCRLTYSTRNHHPQTRWVLIAINIFRKHYFLSRFISRFGVFDFSCSLNGGTIKAAFSWEWFSKQNFRNGVLYFLHYCLLSRK